MKQFALVVLIVFVSSTVYSQERLSLMLSPLSLADEFSFPTIQAGIEFPFSERLSWYNEFGLKYRRSTYDKGWDTLFTPSKGLKLKTELRYYLNDGVFDFLKKKRLFKKPYRTFFAFNFFYTNDVRTNGVNYYYHNDSSQQRTDVYKANKKMFGFNFLIGKQKNWGDHFGLETYVGGGTRFRRVTTNHQEFDPLFDQWITPVDLTIPTIFSETEVKQRHDVTGNFSFGVRIFYRL